MGIQYSRRHVTVARARRRPRIGILLALGVVWTARAAVADPAPPMIVLDNGVTVTSNETPDFGPLMKRYPLAGLVDGQARTAWVFEGDRKKAPALRISIPRQAKLDRLVVINGYAKTPALYRQNNIVEVMSVDDGAGGEPLTVELRRTLAPQAVPLGGRVARTIEIKIDRVIPGERYDDTCLSELDLISGGVSLLRRKAYITRGGGEYPRFALWRGGERLAEFPAETVIEAFFIEGGAYAVFVHSGEEMPGVTVYKLATGARRRLLGDVLIVPGTLRWRDGRFVGRAMKPPTDRETPFSRTVALP